MSSRCLKPTLLPSTIRRTLPPRLCAVLGVGFVVYDGLGATGASLGGDLLVLVSALSWGAYAVFSLPLLSRRSPPLTVASYPILLDGVVLLALAAPQLATVEWTEVRWWAWAGFAYSTLLSSAFAFVAWQVGSRGWGGQDARLPLRGHAGRGLFERGTLRGLAGSRQDRRGAPHPVRGVPGPPLAGLLAVSRGASLRVGPPTIHFRTGFRGREAARGPLDLAHATPSIFPESHGFAGSGAR